MTAVDLILWRHADAEPGVPDLARALTPKGLRQAERMAGWLGHHWPEHCRILVSPAVRAQQTARALGRPFRTVDDLAPGASPEALLAAAGWPGTRGTVLVVGHQPTLGEAAARLVAGSAQPWSMRKGAVWWLSARPRDDAPEAAVIRAVIAPDFL